MRVKIFGNANRVLQDGSVDVVVGIDVDTAHKLDEPTRLRQIVAAGLIQIFADEVKRHSNFHVLQVRLS